jgi:hypothetical protein
MPGKWTALYHARKVNSLVPCQESEQPCTMSGKWTALYHARKVNSLVPCQESEQPCTMSGKWTALYHARKVSSLVSCQESEQPCTMPGKWTALCTCARSIDLASFYEISIGFWNCSDTVVFFVCFFIILFFPTSVMKYNYKPILIQLNSQYADRYRPKKHLK